jgi:hypothetical protein
MPEELSQSNRDFENLKIKVFKYNLSNRQYPLIIRMEQLTNRIGNYLKVHPDQYNGESLFSDEISRIQYEIYDDLSTSSCIPSQLKRSLCYNASVLFRIYSQSVNDQDIIEDFKTESLELGMRT